MNNFFQKHKNGLSVIIFLAVFLPLTVWGWHFLLTRIESKADKIQEKIMDNELTEKKIQNISRMEKTDTEFEADKDATETIFASGDDIKLIEYLEKLADDSGNAITIKALEKKKEVKPKAVSGAGEEGSNKAKEKEAPKSLEEKLAYKNYMYFQVDLTGNYAQLLNFMRKLENSPRYINLISFSVKKELAETDREKQNLRVGDVIAVTSPAVSAPAEKEAVLKSSLVVVVYKE